MTTPNTTASPPELCPDCGWVKCPPGCSQLNEPHCEAHTKDPWNRFQCARRVVDRLKSDLATTQAKLESALVADRNATRLALLDELVAGACGRPRCDCWIQVIEQVLRPKYTQPVEPGQESK